ncbi:MAG: Histidinol dehydrogenase [Bacteroidota bacterium]
MIQLIKFPLKENYSKILERPALDALELDETILSIFQNIERNGDMALREFTEKFDKREIKEILYSEEEIDELASQTPKDLQDAIKQAANNIEKFHASQKMEVKKIETSPGVICWQKPSPIEKIGIYIPGGTAPLFSTILMLAIPAKIAGCKEIVLSTPGQHPAIFYTAKICGITMISKIGGAQAIASLSLGTESIPKVYKIFGPGNQYVTAAKMYANRIGTAIDMPAGPSEVAVYGDSSANAAFIASDLLSQAEHGLDSQVIFITENEALAHEVISELEIQLGNLSRKDLAKGALENSKIILVNSQSEAIELLNEYGAEHLILATDQAEEMAEMIHSAGSIFLGNYTPESAGDYASGTNHTLPTNGYAKMYSGVNLDSFIKKITIQKISKEGLENLGQTIIKMAEAESLDAHANAVKIRLKNGL